ncbi:MAG TPA: hypothetical protein VET65_07900 [Candidatus Limnocylindrales bacterium]|nr:hypothetical protein [Candidatus Limnocylindrales bacterium]
MPPSDAPGEGLLGRLAVGVDADIVILDRDRRVRLTMVGGRVR